MSRSLVQTGSLWVVLVAALPLAWPAIALTGPALEMGSPHLRHYPSAEIDAHDQFWAVEEAEDGALLFAHGSGLSLYDGARWNPLSEAPGGRIYDFERTSDGRIYLGSTERLGYLEPRGDGTYRYRSLLPAEGGVPPFGDVREVVATPNEVFFASSEMLFSWTSERGLRWSEVDQLLHIQQVDDQLLLVSADQGVVAVDPSTHELLPVPGTESLRDQGVVRFSKAPDGGLWAFGSQAIFERQAEGFVRWPTEFDGQFATTRITTGSWLSDGTLLVGTRNLGLVHLDSDGSVIRSYGEAQGLAEPWITDFVLDRSGTLWLTHGSNGVSRIDFRGGVSLFPEDLGVEFAEQLARHRGHLFAATQFGLRVLRPAGNPFDQAEFVPVAGAPEATWALLDLGDTLLVGGVDSVFELEIVDDSASPPAVRFRRLSDGHRRVATFTLVPGGALGADSVYATLSDGILRLDRQGSGWVSRGKHREISTHTYFAEPAGTALWVGTVNSGYLRIEDLEHWPDSAWTQYGPEDGVPNGNAHLFRWQGEILFGTYDGVWTFEADRSPPFQPDRRFEERLIDTSTDVHRFVDPPTGPPWMIAGSTVGPLVRRDDGVLAQARNRLRHPSGWRYYSLHIDPSGVVWVGGREGVVRHDPAAFTPPPTELPPVRIGKISRLPGGETVWGGQYPLPVDHRLALETPGAGLRFEYSLPDSIPPESIRFRSRLRGLDEVWSPWSTETQRDFTNLPGGDLVFEVEVLNYLGYENRSIPIVVQVARAWHQTWPARLAGLLVLILSSWMIALWRTSAVRRRNEELERAVAQRTAEVQAQASALEEANQQLHEMSYQDLLTGLGNRRMAAELIESEISWLRRGGDLTADGTGTHDLSLLLVDVDHFKQVNDRFGHTVGDRMLQSIAQILLQQSRGLDGVVRWGGEEFLVVCRRSPRDEIAEVAERLRSTIAGTPLTEVHGRPLGATVSIGFATYPLLPGAPETMTWDRVLQVADLALYAAKHSGRNGWVGITRVGAALGPEDTPPAFEGELPLRRQVRDWLAQGRAQVVSSFESVAAEAWQTQTFEELSGAGRVDGNH